MSNRVVPDLDGLKSFGHAVAGHAGTMSDEDGKLFIKPCVQAEIDFYETAERDYPDLADLMPVFMGTLLLTDPADQRVGDTIAGVISEAGDVKTTQQEIAASITEQVKVASAAAAVDAGPASNDGHPPEWVPTKGGKIKTDTAVVLENSAHGFKHPNILDLKLGLRLWADDAPEKKKIKFDKIAQETTHKNFGFRIAGMRVYRGAEDASQLDDEAYKSYDKDYGRTMVNDGNLVSEIRKFVFNSTAGINEELGQAVCKAFTSAVQNVEDVLMKHETRMYSASLLFIFEGDGETLREAIKKTNAAVDSVTNKELMTKRVDSGIVLEDEADEELAELMQSLPPVFSVKLIDFAHATWEPGQGPDENMLMGVRSIKEIFQGMAGDD